MMSSATFARWSGWALFVSGPVGVVDALLTGLLYPGHRATAQQILSVPWMLGACLYLTAFLLLALGLPALYRQWAAPAGGWGVAGFVLTALGVVVGGVAVGLLQLTLIPQAQADPHAFPIGSQPDQAATLLFVTIPVLMLASGAIIVGGAGLRTGCLRGRPPPSSWGAGSSPWSPSSCPPPLKTSSIRSGMGSTSWLSGGAARGGRPAGKDRVRAAGASRRRSPTRGRHDAGLCWWRVPSVRSLPLRRKALIAYNRSLCRRWLPQPQWARPARRRWRWWMDRRLALADVSVGRPPQPVGAASRPRGALIVARAAWGAAAALVLGLFLASLPPYLAHLQAVCLHQPCLAQQLTPRSAQALQAAGLSVATYAVLAAALALGAAVVWILLGGLLMWRRSDDGMAVLVAFLLVVGGASNGLNPSSATSPASGMTPANLLTFLSSLAIVVVFALFPSGHFAPRWIRWLIPAFLLNSVPYVLFAGWYARLPGWAGTLGLLDFVGCVLLLVLAQVYRYRRVSTPLQRQQTKWILFTFSAGVALLLGGSLLERLVPSLAGSLYDPALASVNALGSLLFPLALVVAILRYRLWDIDILINRTLVYGALTASVAGLYILVVGYLGAIFRTGSSLPISLLATGAVAVLFQPLRGWLQRGVNRLMYGQRDEPYAVVARLGRRLEHALAPEAVLPTIVETVAQALNLPYAAILLQRGAAVETAASYGTPVGQPLVLPLTYHSEVVGQLVLGPRRRGDVFTPADQHLLADLARQVAPAAHAVRLSADLQRSRERLVTAREEERRRLRRDLHDGLGPALGSLILQLDTARALLPRDPAAGDAVLVDLKGQVQATLDDIRRLVYALRPPTLDELGLVSALREQVTRCSQTRPGYHPAHAGVAPRSPAAVEGALYRIAQEALTNVVRHAHASACVVSLEVAHEHEARLEVRDDGHGLPAHARAGVGMASMRERAVELGGTCLIEPGVGGGTRVAVRLPLPQVTPEDADGHTAARADR